MREKVNLRLMGKRGIIMSNTMTLTKHNYEALKKAAAERHTTTYFLGNKILTDFNIANNEEKVILSIPKELTKDRVKLKEWFDKTLNTILNFYHPKES